MHKDATGREITKGSYIAYGTTTGARAGIKFGAVVKLKERTYERDVYDNKTQTWGKEPHTSYSIQIIAAEQKWAGPYPGGRMDWSIVGKTEGKLARVQSIDRMERVIMLEPHQMNQEAKEVLDKELHERGTI